MTCPCGKPLPNGCSACNPGATLPMTEKRAEREIAAVLKRLEEATGTLVDAVLLNRLDVTTLQNERRRHLMEVRVVTTRLPGHEWPT